MHISSCNLFFAGTFPQRLTEELIINYNDHTEIRYYTNYMNVLAPTQKVLYCVHISLLMMM